MNSIDTNFLNDKEYNSYNEKNRYFNRTGSIIKNNGEKVSLSKDIESAISGFCSEHIRRSNNSTKLITIEVNETDGMTWLSQRLYDINKSNYSTFNFYNIDNSAKDIFKLPTIAYIIGRKKFIRLAVKNKISEGYFSLFPLSNWFLFIVSSILSIIVQIATYVLRNATQEILSDPISSLFSPTLLLIFLLIVLLLTMVKLITEKSLFESESSAIKGFMENLNELEKDVQEFNNRVNTSKMHLTKVYQKFINQVTDELIGRNMPRFFIVDNYSRLDFTTKSVVQNYHIRNINDEILSAGKEVWLVTEPKNSNDKLSTYLIVNCNHKENQNYTQLQINPFTINEKKELIKAVNGDLSRIKFTNAQFICNGQGNSNSYIFDTLKEYIKPQNNNNRTILDFFYLLSLTTFPNHFFFSQKKIRIDFHSDSSPLRTKILQSFLKGVKLNKIELTNFFNTISQEFSEFIIVDTINNTNRITPINDVSITMLQNETELGLPSRKLGHIFWVLYWGEVLKNYPFEAFWIEKLSNHIIDSDFSLIPKESYDDYLLHLFDSCIYTIEGSISTGILYNTYDLLESAKDLLICSSNINLDSCKRLTLLCWKSYVLSKDDRIINIFTELNEEYTFNAIVSDNDLLFEFYLEMIPIPIIGGNQNIKKFSNWILNFQDGKSIKDFIKAQSIWIALTAFPSSGELNMILISKAAEKGYFELDALLDLLLKNSKIDNNSDTVINLVTISILQWACCLKFQNATNSFKRDGLNDYYNDFNLLLEHSLNIIEFLKANNLVRKEGEIHKLCFFIKAIIGELLLSILSSLSVSFNFINQSPYKIKFEDDDQRLFNKVKKVVESVNEINKIDLVPLIDIDCLMSSSFVYKVEELFDYQLLIWQKLNFQDFYSNLVIKRIQYNILLKKDRGIESIDKSLLSSIQEVLNQRTQIGVLANIVISKYLEKISELSSFYFTSAGHLTIEGEFGEKIIQDISILIMVYFNRLNIDLTRFAEKTIEDQASFENSFLFKVLSEIPETKLFNILLKLSNSSFSVKNEAIAKKFKSSIRSYPNKINSNVIKRKSKALFEYIDLTEDINKTHNVDSNKVLDEWIDKRDLYIYAAILQMLISRGYSDDRIKNETLKILDNPADSSYNSYLHLAIEYSERFLLNSDTLTNDEERIVIGYIIRNYHSFEEIETADINSRIFRILNSFYPSEYSRKLAFWEEKVVEIEHKQLIPELLKKGHYFILFKKYVENMLHWGLIMDIDRNSYRESLYIEEKRKKKEVNDWLNSNSRIPEPICNANISSEFLIIGSYLFSISVIGDPNYEANRNDFNQIAKSSINKLVDEILQLPKIPVYYKEILEDFYSRLENYKLLKEFNNISV